MEMEARMMRGKRFLFIFACALMFVHCGEGDHAQTHPQIRGTLDLTTLPSAPLSSPSLVSAARKDQTKILALALGPDDEWIEVPVARDGSFAITCQRGHSYTLAFLAEDSQGQRTFLGVVAFANGDSGFRFFKVGKRDVDVGVVRLTQGENSLWIGVVEHAPPAYALSSEEDEPPEMEEPAEVVEGNRIILPQPGLLEFNLVRADASLMSDLYLTMPYELLLIADRDPGPFQVWDFFEAGTEIQLAIEVDGRPLGLGSYRHSSLSGYAKVTRLSNLQWQIAFEDLPWYLADWDFNDLVVKMKLKPVCDFDQDGYEHLACGGSDYCDHDPNNWTETGCASCGDEDGDLWFIGCDAYTSIPGPDCNDADENNWVSCSICKDQDGDLWSAGCDAYLSINGPDCNDADENNWISCATCQDQDRDSWFVGCNAYLSIHGPDCNDADENNWISCATCQDVDGDAWFVSCDAYASLRGPDCNDETDWIYPGAIENCDGLDNQCSGDAGYGYTDENCSDEQSWPVTVKTLVSGDAANDIFVQNNRAYIASGVPVVTVLDVSNPASPFLIDSCRSPSSHCKDSPTYTLGIWVNDQYAYLTNLLGGLSIINVSNPYRLSLVGSYPADSAYGIFVRDNFAYLANGRSGLSIIDIADPSSPQKIGGYDTPGYAVNVHVNANYAYVADDESGIQIIDVSNPVHPFLISSYDTPSSAREIQVQGNYGYVAASTSGLLILDLSNIESPNMVASLDTGSAAGLCLRGRYVYLADWLTGFEIINISNPTSPIVVGTIFLPPYYNNFYNHLNGGIYVEGNYAYLTEHFQGIDKPALRYRPGIRIVQISR